MKEIMIYNEVEEVMAELFNSLLSRHQFGFKTSM